MESQLSLEKKINIIAFLDHFLELFKFLVFHEATFWLEDLKKRRPKPAAEGGKTFLNNRWIVGSLFDVLWKALI